MSEWKVSTLQGLIVLLKDGTHGTHKDFPNGIPMLSAKDILNGEILIPDDARTISENDYNTIHSTYEINEDDILLTIVGTIGRCAIVKKNKKKFTLQRSVGIIRVNKNIVSPEYIYNYFQSKEFQLELEKSINASAQGGIYLGKLGKIEISYPVSLSEQSKIATRLSSINLVIEKTKSTIAKYKAIKQGMLHDLFTRGIDIQTGKLRPKYKEVPELYKQSELGLIPKDWLIDPLNNLCSMKSGEGITSKSIQEIGDFAVYGGNGLRGYTSTYTHTGEYTLIGRQGALCGNITRVGGKFYASEHAVVVTSNSDVDIDWLSQVLDNMNLNQYSEASAQPGLSVNKILRLRILRPHYEEQKFISDRLIQIDKKICSEQTYLQKLQKIKTGLMNDLLTGKKKLQITE